MRTQTFLLLCPALIFTACAQESDFADRSDIESLMTLAAFDQDVPISVAQNLQSDPCIEFTTTNWVIGQVRSQPPMEMLFPQTQMSRLPDKCYIIEASGATMSELFTRGLTELNLMLNMKTNKLVGSFTTTFYYGEVLQMEIDDVAQVSVDSQTMHLQVNINTAMLNDGKNTLELANGQMRFSFPLDPEDLIEMTFYINTTLCLPGID